MLYVARDTERTLKSLIGFGVARCRGLRRARHVAYAACASMCGFRIHLPNPDNKGYHGTRSVRYRGLHRHRLIASNRVGSSAKTDFIPASLARNWAWSVCRASDPAAVRLDRRAWLAAPAWLPRVTLPASCWQPARRLRLGLQASSRGRRRTAPDPAADWRHAAGRPYAALGGSPIIGVWLCRCGISDAVEVACPS
jgi:hypothetical protein